MDDNLIQALVEQERFALVSQEQLEKVILEMNLSREALVKANTQAKVGKKTAAEGVLVGVVTDSAPGFQVVAHYVDVRTSEVLASSDVYGEELTLPELQILLEGLAWKIKRHFPLSEGLVLKTEGKRIFVDLGVQHKLKKHMKLVLFRDGEVIKHPITGKVLHTETEILTEAWVDAVFDDVSRAVLLQPEIASEIKQLDRVMTK